MNELIHSRIAELCRQQERTGFGTSMTGENGRLRDFFTRNSRHRRDQVGEGGFVIRFAGRT
jgi:hypothetical protein